MICPTCEGHGVEMAFMGGPVMEVVGPCQTCGGLGEIPVETLRQRLVRFYLQRDDVGFEAALNVVDELLAACKAVSAQASEVHLFALQSPAPSESQMYAGMVGAAGAFKAMVDDVIFKAEGGMKPNPDDYLSEGHSAHYLAGPDAF